jgi:hypothetical protein
MFGKWSKTLNTKVLQTRSMLNLSAVWLEDESMVAELGEHPLGAASCDHLRMAHEDLASQYSLKNLLTAELERLTEVLQVKDFHHDRKARALSGHLEALASGTDDAELASFYNEVRELLFPYGLRVVQFSYTEEAGALREIERAVTPELLRRLKGVRVGDATLADLYNDWVEVGKELGQLAQERARQQASLTRQGTAPAEVNSSHVRSGWIRAVRLLADALAVLPVSDEVREKFFAPLEACIAEALKRRQARAAGNAEPGAEPDTEPDTDTGTEPDTDTGAEPGLNADTGAAAAAPEAVEAALMAGPAMAEAPVPAPDTPA